MADLPIWRRKMLYAQKRRQGRRARALRLAQERQEDADADVRVFAGMRWRQELVRYIDGSCILEWVLAPRREGTRRGDARA